MYRIRAIITFLLLSGCSAQQIHDALQAREKQECYSAPDSEYEECMRRTSESYEEYSAKRKEVSEN
jgi:hypothetical protein